LEKISGQFRGRQLGGIAMRVDDRVRETQKQKFIFTAARNEHVDLVGELFGSSAHMAHSSAADETAPVVNDDANPTFEAVQSSKSGARGALSARGSSVSGTGKIIHDDIKNKKIYIDGSTGREECVRLVRHVRLTPIPVTSRNTLPQIAVTIMEAKSVALDLETYGPRKGDGLDPLTGDIRLLSL